MASLRLGSSRISLGTLLSSRGALLGLAAGVEQVQYEFEAGRGHIVLRPSSGMERAREEGN